MLLLSHPTGNANVRHAALGLARAGLLTEFRTCFAVDPGAAWLSLLPGGLAEKLRAGGSGIAAFYTQTGVGTQVAEGGLPRRYALDGSIAVASPAKDVRSFDVSGTPRDYVLEEAIVTDFALVHAAKGATHGNLIFNKAARNFNPLAAMAGRICIAQVERLVEPPAHDRDPDLAPLRPLQPLDRLVEGERRGGLALDGADHVAGADPEEFVAVFKQTPAVHRFPGSMAGRVQELAQVLLDEWDGDAAAIWTSGDPDGPTVLKRLKKLPGFGEQKARIFLALLGKQVGFAGAGWREASDPYGEEGSFRSVADIVSPDSLLRVRESKRAAKAAAKSATKVSASTIER